jgi:hypothetical protein
LVETTSSNTEKVPPKPQLVARIDDLLTEALQELEGSDADLRKDVARNEEPDAHFSLSLFGRC